eukprot:TRINITY_DN27094_c0_g2_i1.p1 TRINITY_DN27094_c0_g2~~TRINITY_DN27094_c0_g2_i1.p1  ORF type:complete len:294 (-),score=51.61 TRINITY_DN27094_c0_g2_i1:334-1215(-)
MAMMQRPRQSSSVTATAPTALTNTAPQADTNIAVLPTVPSEVASSPSVDAAAATAGAGISAVEGALVEQSSAAATALQRAPATTTASARRPAALTPKERREASMLAELYSILVSTEHLETAFVRGAVSNEDYEKNCTQILAQFKTLRLGLRDKVPDIRAFMKEHGLNCPLAEERLLGTGVAATALYSSGTAVGGKESLACFKASEGFITLSDALKLNLTAVDELLPIVRDLQASILSIPSLPPLSGIGKIAEWLVRLNAMRATDHLDEGQCRQLAMEVEQAYTSLKNWLQEKQ